MEYRDAISIQGYLQKQSPTVFKIYQTRYFAYRNMGEFLIWFKKKPTSINDVPKGIMKTKSIEILQDDQSDERVFRLYYETREFILRAVSQQMKEKWLRSIQVVKEHFKKAQKNQIIKEENSNIKNTWRWEKLNGDVVQKIRIQNQKLLLNEGEDKILQNSSKMMTEFFNKTIGFEIERNFMFGMLKNQKYFLCHQTKLYFMFSEFNLFDEKDDNLNDKVNLFLHQIEKDKKQAKAQTIKQQSDDDDSEHQQLKKAETQKKQGFDINQFYQLDIKTKQITLSLNLVDVDKWKQNLEEKPFSLSINYTVFNEKNVDEEEQQKEIVLTSDYLSQIKKWNKAFEIIFQRYSIRKQRQVFMEKRFVKYQIRLLKIDQEVQWRVMGSNNAPDYAYLNKEQLKVSGHIFQLVSINSSIKSQKLQIVYKEKGEDVKKEALITKIDLQQKRKLQIVFQSKEIEKQFRKKLKKNIKKIELGKKKEDINLQPLKNQIQINESTYFLQKKIKETNSSIKVNFYEMMQREVSGGAVQKPIKKESTFDRFLSMFCGPPNEESWSLSS